MRNTFRLWLTLWLGLFTVTGCTIDAVRDGEHWLAETPATGLARAEALKAAGDSARAAEHYLRLAANAQPPARQQLQLSALEAWLKAGNTLAAQRIVATIDHSLLTVAQREWLLLLQAELALQDGQGINALAHLQQVNANSLAAPMQELYLARLAAASRLAGNPAEAVLALDRLAALPLSRERQLEVQVALLATLEGVPRQTLATWMQDRRQRRLHGWAELAQLVTPATRLDTTLRARFSRWSEQNRSLNVLPELPEAYFAARDGRYRPAMPVTVLLPTSGAYSEAAAAVRAGLEAADAANRSGERPQLNFQAVGNNAATSYQNAVHDGAQLVIGPLRKAAVDRLATQATLSVPVLALNRPSVDRPTPEQLGLYGLAPEEETAQIAMQAWRAGLRSALVLYPQGDWGRRIAESFINQWRALGGQVAHQEIYGDVRTGYAASTASLMASGRGELVFLVATRSVAGELYPILDNANVRRLPVIATSHVYDGGDNPARDSALTGLYFTDIPWMIEPQTTGIAASEAATNYRSGSLARLFAMGVDAYRLAPRFVTLRKHPELTMHGLTGGLNVDSRGQVHRRLLLARFTERGVARVTAIQPAS